ncbi:hypothetical protein MELA_03008, partial [Candidatus Methylomirabilis lanthanidiphila]
SSDKTGWSEERTGIFGDKYTQHYDRGPSGTGVSQEHEPENSRYAGSSQGSSSAYFSSSNSPASSSSGPSISGAVGFLIVLGIVAVFIYNALSPTSSSPPMGQRTVKHISGMPAAFLRLFSEYAMKSNKKAIALAIDSEGKWAAGYSAGHSSQSEATERALSECRQRLPRFNVQTSCKLYAIGTNVIFTW